MIKFVSDTELPKDCEKIGNLAYGTPLKLSSSRYIKVNKTKLGDNVTLRFPSGHSVLLNLKLGTLRSVPGDTVVQVLEITAAERPGNAAEHLKF